MAYTKNVSVPSLEECLAAADQTRDMRIKKNCCAEIPEILENLYHRASVCLVADGNTWEAAGKKTGEILKASGIKTAGVYLFPAEPRLHAEYFNIKTLMDWFSTLPSYRELVPIAVGGGTINDLVKRAAFEMELPYLCVPTSASVDGYTAYGAAILMDGFKQTIPCTAPLCLMADTDVLAAAPAFLSSSGFGDLASKIIAGSDWIIADAAASLGAPAADKIDEKAWNMIQPGLLDYLHRSVKAAEGCAGAVNALFEALAITGFSMQYFKSSRPVSGSEHLFSHVWEMDDLSIEGVPVTHGHKVSIGTLAATAFTEIYFADPSGPPGAARDFRRPSREERKAQVSAAYKGSRARDGAVKTALDKLTDDKTAENIGRKFRDEWKDIRDRVLEQILPYRDLKQLMGSAGCPLVPGEINLKRSDAIAAARRAQMMRNKYTILDLAWDTGVLELILAKMEDSPVYLR